MVIIRGEGGGGISDNLNECRTFVALVWLSLKFFSVETKKMRNREKWKEDWGKNKEWSENGIHDSTGRLQ